MHWLVAILGIDAPPSRAWCTEESAEWFGNTVGPSRGVASRNSLCSLSMCESRAGLKIPVHASVCGFNSHLRHLISATARELMGAKSLCFDGLGNLSYMARVPSCIAANRTQSLSRNKIREQIGCLLRRQAGHLAFGHQRCRRGPQLLHVVGSECNQFAFGVA